MKRAIRILSIIFPCVAMLALILDSKTALLGAEIGLELCIKTVIPSLFPFFVISILLTGMLSGYNISALRPILKLCKMPPGTESLLIVGLLGGYPVGAKCVYDAWRNGCISKDEAQRCLGFCNNAGPAFIFGICGTLFHDVWIAWILWGIHIVSALLVGLILPATKQRTAQILSMKPVTLPEAVSNGIAAMIGVCGWVILFRVVIAFSQRWFLWFLPKNWQVIVEGLLELTNGCTSLLSVESESLRLILCACFLGFGGLCVGLQTISVAGELGTGKFFVGKVIQCAISGCMATLFASFQFRLCSPLLPIIAIIVLLLPVVLKKTVDFPKKLVYNVTKDQTGGLLCYSERKLQNPAAIAPLEQR